jgi:amidase
MTKLTDLSACELTRMIASRAVSAEELMRETLDRIERFNPKVNAIVSLVPREEALAQARASDRALAEAGPSGPLHGIPFAVKDLEETAGLLTTYGSPLFKDNIPAEDSLMVSRLRTAGALIIGKTNVPEFGFGSQTYNNIFGATLNAYDQSRTAGGSSGGAAVALALRLLPLADGSDHGGSLRNPAAFNNVYGFRPSPGRIPDLDGDRFGLSLPVLGPMARDIDDLALLFSVQAGPDARVPISCPEPGARFAPVRAGEMAGLRIGWLGDLDGELPMEAGIMSLCEAGLAVLEGLGAAVEPARLGFPPEEIWKSWTILRAWGVAFRLGEAYRDPARRHLLKPEAQWEVEQGLGLSGQDVAAQIERRNAWLRQALNLFVQYDFLALPSAQVFPFSAEQHWPREIAGRTMDSYHRWMEVVTPVTLGGLPALNVPVGFNEAGLPMGMQLIGPPRGDLAVLRLAKAYDDATGWPGRRKPPLLAGAG